MGVGSIVTPADTKSIMRVRKQVVWTVSCSYTDFIYLITEKIIGAVEYTKSIVCISVQDSLNWRDAAGDTSAIVRLSEQIICRGTLSLT